MTQKYSITLLPGDGIGPEIMEVAVDVLKLVGKQFNLNFQFETALIGGAAIDETGEPLPSHTLETCGRSDAVLLAAIGGYKWDSLPANKRPEAGLLGLRAGLELFANLRPAKNTTSINRCFHSQTRSGRGCGYHGSTGTHGGDLFW